MIAAPGDTESGQADFTIERSAKLLHIGAVAVMVTLEVLLQGLGSRVELLTQAVLVMAPDAVELTVARINRVKEASLASVP